MFFVLFGNLNEQIMPTFVPLRALYEARERPSRMYRWTCESQLYNSSVPAIMY